MQENRRLRVLLIAASCNPEMISVPLVGYSQAAALRKITDAHVVTEWLHTEALEKVGWRKGVDFTEMDTRRVMNVTWNLGEKIAGRGKGWTLQSALYVPAYYLFEHLMWKQFGRRIKSREFDIVHRLTPLSPTTPSLLATWCKDAGVPFVIGPLNGGLPWPPGFDAARRQEREWLSYVRGAYQLLPGYRSTRRDAAAIIVASRETLRQTPRQFHDRCFYLPENAIDPARFCLRRTHRAQRPTKVIFIGRLVPYKGADMLIEAAAPLVRAGAVSVDILGDGPMMGQLKQLIESLDVKNGVHLRGWIKHDEVPQWLAQSDIFAFPSVREFGGAVVLEAMAMGVMPVVLDYGGPGELVTDETGVKVSLGTRQEIVERFRTALGRLADSSDVVQSLGDNAYDHARKHFTWDEKAARTLEVYRWVLDPKRDKPL